MIHRVRRLFKDRRGACRAVTILLLVIVVLLGIAAIPIVKDYLHESAAFACRTALDSARRRMAEDFMLTSSFQTAEGMKEVVADAMHGWDDLCPSMGTVYIVEDESGDDNMPFELVCGLHDSDTKLCTQLNARNVLNQIREEVKKSRDKGVPYPESVTVKLHNKDITALLVDDYTGLRRGTDTTNGYEGIVVYYSIVGHSEFGKESKLAEGEVWYFSYADEAHCANWSSKKSWTGDSYE